MVRHGMESQHTAAWLGSDLYTATADYRHKMLRESMKAEQRLCIALRLP